MNMLKTRNTMRVSMILLTCGTVTLGIAASGNSTQPGSAGVSAGLYRHYKFDALIENGAATPDASPHKARARLSGQDLCEGVIGKALRFKAGHKGVVLGDLGLQAPATLCFWVRSDGAQTDGRILSQLEGPTTQHGCLRLSGGSLEVWNAAGWPVALNGLSNKGVWQHVAVVYKADGTVTGYLNGKAVHTVRSAFDFKGVTAAIGALFLGRHGTPFIGALDDFRIYNTALKDGEIKALYPPALFGKSEARAITLVGSKNLNGMVQALEEAIRKGMDDRRAQFCRTIIDRIKSDALPITLKAELLTLIVRFGGAESVDYLSALLHHEDPVFNTRAVLGLQRNPSESAAVALRKALAKASGPELQAALIHALSERGDSACLPQAIKLAESRDKQVRNLALRAVARLSDEPHRALFQAAIKQASSAARMDAVNAYLAHADRLAEIGKKREAASVYRELIALGGRGKGDALMRLVLVAEAEQRGAILKAHERITAADPDLKARLLGVLGSSADPASLDAVLTAARDANERVRRAALTALGHFGHERATNALIAAVVAGKDLNTAVQSLERSPARNHLTEKLKKVLPAVSAPVRASVVRLLGNCPKAECVPVLLGTLKDADSRVRAEALDALARAGEPSTYAPVVEFLAGEPDRKVRSRAMAALSALGKCGVAPAERSRLVVGRLTKGDCPGRAELIAMLPKATSASSLESELKILDEALVSKDRDISGAAIRALQEWPDPDVVLDVLLLTAGKGPDSVNGVLALRAYTAQLKRLAEKRKDAVSKGRMTDQDARKELVQRYRKGLGVAVTRLEKCGLLSGLSGQAHVDALRAALDRFDDKDVEEEAMLAAYTISAALGKNHAQAAKPVLEKIIATTGNKELKENASNLLKSHAADAAPANAIILFNGTDTSAWMQHRGMQIPTDDEMKAPPPCHYKLVDGALETNDPGHLVTKQHFNDFRLHVEVWLPGEDGINSGIWTHFRYCNEIRGRGEKGAKYRLGAIYGLKAPDVDASRPARTWQALDITFRNARFDRRGKKTENARITVLLNGVTIHDDVEIKSRCPTLMEPEGPSPGPIVLENHGSRGRVRFRNIWIVPR